MATKRISVGPFSKGLVTDQIGVEDALFEATDIIIERGGEICKRGGKEAIDATLAGTPVTNFDAVAHPDTGYIVSSRETGGSYLLIAGSNLASLSSLDARENGSGSTPTGYAYAEFRNMFQHGAEVLSSGSSVAGIKWGGSTASLYETGTVTTVADDATITGSGTSWTSSHEGMYLWINHATLGERAYRVVDVTSSTTLEVDRAPDVTEAVGQSYALNPVGFVACQDGIFCNSSGTNVNYVRTDACTSHKGRVFAGGTYEPLAGVENRYRQRLRWSATEAEGSGKFIGVDNWNTSAYLDVGVGVGGGITALASYRGELLIFKQRAIYALTGDVATDGTDLGASVELVSSGHGVASPLGVVVTPLGVVFTTVDGVFVYEGGGQLRSLTDGVIGFAVRERTGFGAAATTVSWDGRRIIVGPVFFSSSTLYYFVYDTFTRSWTEQRLTGTTAQAGSRVVNAASIGTSSSTRRAPQTVDAYLLDWNTDFDIASGGTDKNDANSSAYPRMKITTHPLPLGKGTQQGRVNTVYVNGYVTDAASDNPTLDVKLLYGRKHTYTGAESAVSVASISEGSYDKTHRLPVDGGRSDYSAVRIQVHQTNASSDARVYGIDVDVAPSSTIA